MKATNRTRKTSVSTRATRVVKSVDDRVRVHSEVVNVARRSSVFARLSSFVLILFFVFVPLADAKASETEGAAQSSSAGEDVSAAPEVSKPEPAVGEEEATPSVEAAAAAELIQPVVPSEDVVPEVVEEAVTEDSIESESSDEVAVVPPSSPVDATLVATTTPVDATTVDVVGSTATTAPSATGLGSTASSTLASSSASEVQASTSPEVAPTPVAEPVSTSTIPSPLPVADIAQESLDIAPAEEGLDAATSTEESEEATPLVMGHTSDSDIHSFGMTECVAVGNGAFHCVKRDATARDSEREEVVTARRDDGGDLEIIFSEMGREPRALTSNDYDDDAPMYDEVGEKVVWHSLVNDRYQIMTFDLDTNEVEKLTEGSGNSMQPSSYDGVVVYQSWVNNNWEVMMNEGGEVTQLTENDSHDIAPSINDEYITWQSDEAGEWVVRIYDRKTEAIETVRGIEGGKVNNPRMVLVFDNKKENGDIETIGYDPERGTTVPLSATAAPTLPERIPEPEEQQEEKALIQPPTTTRVETRETQASTDGPDPETEDDIDVSEPELVVASSTESGVTPSVHSTSTPTVDEATLTLDLRPVVDEAAPVIPDLIIPKVDNPVSDAMATTKQ